MALTSGLTCQQKSAGSHVKLGEKSAAATPVLSLLPPILAPFLPLPDCYLYSAESTLPVSHCSTVTTYTPGSATTHPWGVDKKPLETLFADGRGTSAYTDYLTQCEQIQRER